LASISSSFSQSWKSRSLCCFCFHELALHTQTGCHAPWWMSSCFSLLRNQFLFNDSTNIYI
jgi:hypothetical protein